jgi:hypothetical protein
MCITYTENLHIKYTENLHMKYTENLHINYTENLHLKYTENLHIKYTENLHIKYAENLHIKYTENELLLRQYYYLVFCTSEHNKSYKLIGQIWRIKYRLFWGNEGICDLFTEARSAEVNKHIPPPCLKITYTYFSPCEVALVIQNRSNSQCQIAFVMLFFSHFLCCKDIAGEY